MPRLKVYCVATMAAIVLGAASHGQHPEKCSYSVLTNGPTWDSDTMRIPWDVSAAAWARDGAYGGSAVSNGSLFHTGGAGVAVAAVSYWFKVTHNALPQCGSVTFESESHLEAEVSTKTGGALQDYALAAGLQAVSGNALQPASLVIAATNSGSPVQNSTVGVSFGTVNFTLTIPGVSVTADTDDRNRNTAFTWGSKKIEEELISVHAWVKVKVVTNGPFGGYAKASVDRTRASATTKSTCPVHEETGSFTYDVTEG